MNRLVVSRFATKRLDQLDGRTNLAEGIQLQDLDVLDVLDARVGVLVQQGLQHLASGTRVFGKVVALFHLLGALSTSQRRLVEGDMADEVEGVERLSALGLHF